MPMRTSVTSVKIKAIAEALEALETLRITRNGVRGVFWDECHAVDAEPLMRLNTRAAMQLARASIAFRHACDMPRPRRQLFEQCLADVEQAWVDTHAALDGWGGVPSQLLPGDDALEKFREAVECLLQDN